MPRVHEGKLEAGSRRFAIVVARFNSLITGKLLDGALDCLRRHGCPEDNVEIAWVPGSFELPLVARRLAGTGRFDVIICLGAVIRGETPHFDYVSSESAKGITSASIETGVPTIYGVLTCNTLEQAIDRAGAKGGNKGFDAAMTAIEMATLMKDLRKSAECED